MVNLLHGNYETSIFEICFHGFPKLFEENSPGWVISMPAPAASPRSWELGDVVFGCHSGCFPVGSQAMTHAKQGIELFNATKDTTRWEYRWQVTSCKLEVASQFCKDGNVWGGQTWSSETAAVVISLIQSREQYRVAHFVGCYIRLCRLQLRMALPQAFVEWRQEGIRLAWKVIFGRAVLHGAARQWMWILTCQAPSTGRSVDFGLIKAMAQEIADLVKLGSWSS